MKVGAVVALYIAGCVLAMAEIYLPGGVLGLLGGAAFVTAAVLVFKNWSVPAGILFVCLEVLGALASLVIGMKFFPSTRTGRRLVLGSAVRSQEGETLESLVGREGIALTVLRPTGTAEIDGRRYSVVTDGVFLEKGTRVVVVEADSNRLVVRAAE